MKTQTLNKTATTTGSALSPLLIKRTIYVTSQLRDVLNLSKLRDVAHVVLNDPFGDLHNFEQVIRKHRTAFLGYVCHSIIPCYKQQLGGLTHAKQYFETQFPDLQNWDSVGSILDKLTATLSRVPKIKEDAYTLISKPHPQTTRLIIDAEYLMRPEDKGAPIFVRDIYQNLAEALSVSRCLFELCVDDCILTRHLFRDFNVQSHRRSKEEKERLFIMGKLRGLSQTIEIASQC